MIETIEQLDTFITAKNQRLLDEKRLQDLADKMLRDAAHPDDGDPTPDEMVDVLCETFGMTRAKVLELIDMWDISAMREVTA